MSVISVAKVKEFLKNIEEQVSNKQQNIPTILDKILFLLLTLLL